MREELFNKLYRRFWRGKKTYSAMLEITSRCNLRCQFCYIPDKYREQRDIPLKKLFKIVDQLAQVGCMEIIILGGEPFMRKDFLDIYNYIAQKGLFIDIYTNGTLLKRQALRQIRKYPFHKLRISLYGASSDTYRLLSGNASAFNQVMNGIRLAKKEGINFRIRSVLNKINQRDSRRMEEITSRFKVRYLSQKHLHRKADGDTEHFRLNVSKGGRKRTCEGCIYVDNLGRLNPCPAIRTPSYDLGCVSFKSAWQDRLRRKFKVKCPAT